MELDETEEIILESFSYLLTLLKEKLKFSTADNLGYTNPTNMTVLQTPWQKIKRRSISRQ